MGIFASIEQAYSLRIAERDAQIASLTAENERLRRAISLQISFHEDLIAADLSDMAADAVTVGMVFQVSSGHHIARLKTALQPKEGEK